MKRDQIIEMEIMERAESLGSGESFGIKSFETDRQAAISQHVVWLDEDGLLTCAIQEPLNGPANFVVRGLSSSGTSRLSEYKLVQQQIEALYFKEPWVKKHIGIILSGVTISVIAAIVTSFLGLK